MTNCGTINDYVQSELLDKLDFFESFKTLKTNWLSADEIYTISSLTKLDDIYNSLVKLIILENRESLASKQKQESYIRPLCQKLMSFIETHIFKQPPTTLHKCKIRYINALTFLTCFNMVSYMLKNRSKTNSVYNDLTHLIKLRHETLSSWNKTIKPNLKYAQVLAKAVKAYSDAPVLQLIPPDASPIPPPAAFVPAPIQVRINNPFAAPIPPPAAPVPVTPPSDIQVVQTDITKLEKEGQRKDIEDFLFSTQSLNLLNKGKFKDLSKNNLYFNIDFNKHKLTPKAGPYYNRTYADYAELLRAMLVSGRPGIKILQYPKTMPDTTAGKMVTSVIADMNHDFKYIEPRLNTLNTANVSSFFTSNKATAVNEVLKRTKKLHKSEFENYSQTDPYKHKLKTIEAYEAAINTARMANSRNNNVATAQELQAAKDNFEQILKGFIREATYEEEKKFFEKQKARVLSNKDLYRRAGQQVWETEAPITDAATARAYGGRTRKRR